jgi:hypothetical protein
MNILNIGWREWLALPELGIPAIKAKIDTGARTSALHAFFVEPFIKDGTQMVRFGVHPLQKRLDLEIVCEAPVKDYRSVSDSGGHREMRYVIETDICFGDRTLRAELTLTNRDNMRFRMLLGRTAMAEMSVLPDKSYLTGRLKHKY